MTGEFDLSLEAAVKPKIQKFSIWVDIEKDDEIKIKTNIEEADIIYDHIFVYIGSKSGGRIGLSISPKQAFALFQILQQHIEIIDRIQLLSREKTVRIAA